MRSGAKGGRGKEGVGEGAGTHFIIFYMIISQSYRNE